MEKSKRVSKVVALTSLLLLSISLSAFRIPEAHAQGHHLTCFGCVFTPDPPEASEPCEIRAFIYNNSPDACLGAEVVVYVCPFGAAADPPVGPGWHEAGQRNVDVPGYGIGVTDSMMWTPPSPGLWCIEAFVTCPHDSTPGDSHRTNKVIPEAKPGDDPIYTPGWAPLRTRLPKIWAPVPNVPVPNIRLNIIHLLPPQIVVAVNPQPPFNPPVNGSVDLNISIAIADDAPCGIYPILFEATWENGTAYGNFTVELHVYMWLGDVDRDGDVDIFDIVRMAGVYGFTQFNSGYDRSCDIDNDEDIDIFDIVAAADNYGKTYP